MTHCELVELAYRWILKNASCGIAFKELKTLSWEIPDVIGFGSGGHSVIVECKTSRSDFIKDKSKPFRLNPQLGMGTHRFYCCPKDLIKATELPEGWGLIYADGGKARLAHNPLVKYLNENGNEYKSRYNHQKNADSEFQVLYSALRRLFIKGYVKHIYDKDYSSPRADELIELNTSLKDTNT